MRKVFYLKFITIVLLLTCIFSCGQKINEQQVETVELISEQITKGRNDSIREAEYNDSIKEVELVIQKNDSINNAKRQLEINERKKRTYDVEQFAEMVLIEYEKNEITAEKKFHGQVYYIKGEITEISKDAYGKIYFIIPFDPPYKKLQCFVDAASLIRNVVTGQVVTMKGIFESLFIGGVNGAVINIRMEHCSIIEDR